MSQEKDIAEAINAYLDTVKQFEFKQFKAQVLTFFQEHPKLNEKPFPIIHSIKHRTKDPKHLEDKLGRRLSEGIRITKDNIFTSITDFIGVRILHLYLEQFPEIDAAIKKKINDGDWGYVETTKAYTWDPETQKFFQDLNIETEVRDTYYTSIHYVVKPNNSQNTVCCEIQVRTLFEEIWGEIDHTINYPKKTESIPCREQLRVLAKLVNTGTRLADSIFRSHNDFTKTKMINQDQTFEAEILPHNSGILEELENNINHPNLFIFTEKIEATIFNNQQPLDPHGNNNDHILARQFDLHTIDFEIFIEPKETRFWRLGFVFSKEEHLWPDLSGDRHGDPNFGYIHICVGDRNIDGNWSNENVLSLSTYEVGDPRYVVITEKYYGQRLKLILEKEKNNWRVGLDISGMISYLSYDLSRFRFCKIAAWCDGRSFELITEIKTLDKI